jgi:hypothetical protein
MRVCKRSIHLYSALALSATLLVAGCFDLKVPPKPDADGGAGKGGTGGASGSVKDGASDKGGSGGSGGTGGTGGSDCTCSATDDCCDGCSFYPDTKDCEADSDPMTVDYCDGKGSCVAGENYCDTHDCWKIPPTDQTNCYDNSEQMTRTTFPCNSDGSPDFCGQDAQYSHHTRSFTESTVGSDVIVTDSLTGLVWQKTYVTGYTWQQALDYCEGLSYASETDWRLPDINELTDLVNYGTYNPASNFPGMPSDGFWSSSYDLDNMGYGWGVRFGDGMQRSDYPKTDGYDVRCVRGGTYLEDGTARFFISGATGNEVVLDRATGLFWQKDFATPKTWQQALAYCEGLIYGGYGDWRLPNVNELRSLYDAKNNPASDFPDMPSDEYFWSSTSEVFGNAWFVHFSDEDVFSDIKTESYDVRCVRGGP